jgi:hypothetical protein
MNEAPAMMPTFDPYHYFRDHEDSGAWGLRDARTGVTLAVGLDKSVAAALACLLNGDVASARSLLEYLPDQMWGSVSLSNPRKEDVAAEDTKAPGNQQDCHDGRGE